MICQRIPYAGMIQFFPLRRLARSHRLFSVETHSILFVLKQSDWSETKKNDWGKTNI